jgi:hypothetical protein
MQFIPSTWSTVGVDADGDGVRNPQDINDAALAAAVYLCSGTDDLSSSAGRSKAVYRYNHSASYVATVLAVMESYLAGDYTAAPNWTIPATYFEPAPAPARHPKRTKVRHGQHAAHGSTGAHAAGGGTSAPSGSGSSSSGGGTGSDAPALPEPPKATTSAAPIPSPTAVTEPVADVLSAAEALTLCSEQIDAIPDPLGLLDGAQQACADKVKGKTRSAALALIPNTLNGMVAWLGL